MHLKLGSWSTEHDSGQGLFRSDFLMTVKLAVTDATVAPRTGLSGSSLAPRRSVDFPGLTPTPELMMETTPTPEAEAK